MKNLIAFWNRRGTFAKLCIGFAVLCVFNWTRIAILNGGHIPQSIPSAQQPELTKTPGVVGVEPSGQVSMANYERLATGMTYGQTCALLGGTGQEMSSSDIGGTHTVMYQWKGSGMANMNAMFQNDKLATKAQFGLR